MKRGANQDIYTLVREKLEKKEANDYGFEEYAHILDQLDENCMDESVQKLVPSNTEWEEEVDIYATNPEYQAQDETNYLKQLAMMVNLYVSETKGVKVNNVFESETQTFVTNPPVFH